MNKSSTLKGTAFIVLFSILYSFLNKTENNSHNYLPDFVCALSLIVRGLFTGKFCSRLAAVTMACRVISKHEIKAGSCL